MPDYLFMETICEINIKKTLPTAGGTAGSRPAAGEFSTGDYGNEVNYADIRRISYRQRRCRNAGGAGGGPPGRPDGGPDDEDVSHPRGDRHGPGRDKRRPRERRPERQPGQAYFRHGQGQRLPRRPGRDRLFLRAGGGGRPGDRLFSACRSPATAKGGSPSGRSAGSLRPGPAFPPTRPAMSSSTRCTSSA